jgi:hypothetical protein
LGNSLCRAAWTCRKTDYEINGMKNLTLLTECTKHVENRIIEGEMCFAAVILLVSQKTLKILGSWKKDGEYGNSCSYCKPQLETERFQICPPIQTLVLRCPDEYREPR